MPINRIDGEATMSSSVKELNDYKVILITGASSGFGKACAIHMASLGHHVYGTSRIAEFPSASTFPIIIPMDVRDTASIETTVDYILDREGRLDVLVNNAGYGLAGAIEHTTLEEAIAKFDTNFFGIHRVCRSVLPVMRNQESGLIVNISSIGGLITTPFQGFYCASKYALEAYTESLRMEVKPFGIQVTLIEPGDFKTDITKNRIIALDTSVYEDRQNTAINVIANDEQNGSDPKDLAVLLANIIEKKHVRPRYMIGMFHQKLAAWIKRMLPASLFEKLIISYYKI